MVLRLIAAALLSAVAFILWAITSPVVNVSPAEIEAEEYTVTRVLDGDTIVVNGGAKVRYIGINTPEFYGDSENTECFAQEAKQRNEQFVLGKKVLLKRDLSETDEYGRLLRYVYLNDPMSSPYEATSINEVLVHEGYAFARAFPPDIALQETLGQLEKDAEENGRGLWAVCK